MLILGCGNPDRGDDGAGLAVIHRLHELGVKAVEYTGDMLALLDAWRGSPEVVLIDAAVSGAAPGTITVWDAGESPLPSGTLRCSTHNFGVAEAVELARVMDSLPARLTVYGIEGATFDHGAPLSPAVAEAVERLAGTIKKGAPKGALK
ncbi:MAG TPA: hydrogenase maturation protease [Bryobacteraceae bacterium]|nr:hydrogenase maturation protease [Bryobacteraceae bacterium]